MAVFTQTGKPLRVTTPLGGDVLLVERFAGTEGMSTPYELTLDLLSTEIALDPKALLRKPVTIAVDLIAGGERDFHGLVRRFTQLGRADGLVSYRAEVVPAVWFLSLSTNCRIFQQKSVPDIVKQVLTDGGITDFKMSVTGTHPARDYCVQYRESDLDFISRLLEEEGIFYFFEHTKDKHTIVFADAPATVKAGPVSKLSVNLVSTGAKAQDVITSLDIGSAVCSGKVTLRDHNPETPPQTLERTAAAVSGLAVSSFNLYDYPGGYDVNDDGDRIARLRIEEAEAMSQLITGDTNCRGLASGQKFDVIDHYRKDVNQSYQLVSVQHYSVQTAYRSTTGEPFSFESTFTAIPASVPFRPARVTPKSIVHGSQTAVVVGPAGEEIFTDKYGRVKVQFFWDQLGKQDEHSSCWMRVSNTWAGKNWGFIQIPRIGQEVIVDFLEGDPDRPIITGRVYNAEMMPPYELPANGTQSGVKSRSSKQGTPSDFNEFRFEDKKGSEQILLHAQKAYDIEVEADETHWVGHDRTKTIDHDETTHVKHDRTETVDNNETITIHGARSETVDKDESITIGGSRTENVSKDETITIGGKRTETVGKDETISIGGARTEDVGKDETISIGGARTESVGKDESIEIGGARAVKVSKDDSLSSDGNISIKASAGKIAVEGGQSIELKVGGNSIKIDPSGITIKGMQVKIEGSIMTEVKGLMTTVKADAILTVKGALTMIN
jgi:type VI secretion system secreted protein VgrG